MQFHRIIGFLAALLIAVPLIAAPPSPQSQTFVSSNGNDSHSCSQQQPCRTFAAAIALTTANGEIVVLDSGTYAPVTIAKGLTIVAQPGVHAVVSASTGSAITINAGSDTVALRNLSLTGEGATSGVEVQAAGSVVIDRCTIRRFGNFGVHVGTSAGSVQLSMNGCTLAQTSDGVRIESGTATIRDTIAEGSTWAGFETIGTGSPLTMTLTNCTARNGDHGVWVENGTVIVDGGSAVQNRNLGYYVGHAAPSSTPAILIIRNAEAAHNLHGVYVNTSGDLTLEGVTLTANRYSGAELMDTSSALRIIRSTVTENKYGIECLGGPTTIIRSTGDNIVSGNPGGDNMNCTVGNVTKF